MLKKNSLSLALAPMAATCFAHRRLCSYLLIAKMLRKVLSAAFFLTLSSLSFGQASTTHSNYLSWKEGKFRDEQFHYGDNVKYQKNDGRLRELEFALGYKDLFKVNGGVGFDSDDKVKNFAFGLAFNDRDQFVVREFKIKDRLWFGPGDPFWGVPGNYALADIDASAREVSYVRSLGSADGAELQFTYGTSNLPVQLFIDSQYFIDVKPDTKYFTVGFRVPDLKNMVMKGQQGFDWYFDREMTFGVLTQTLSREIYSERLGNSGAGNAEVDQHGIRERTGYDGTLKANFELGVAYLFNSFGTTGTVSAGAFIDYFYPWLGDLVGQNKTESGDNWAIGGRQIYGFNARVALGF